MEKQVIKFHIWLEVKDDMPQEWQWLPGQFNGKSFIEPDTRRTQAIEVEPQSYSTNEHAPPQGRRKTCPYYIRIVGAGLAPALGWGLDLLQPTTCLSHQSSSWLAGRSHVKPLALHGATYEQK